MVIPTSKKNAEAFRDSCLKRIPCELRNNSGAIALLCDGSKLIFVPVLRTAVEGDITPPSERMKNPSQCLNPIGCGSVPKADGWTITDTKMTIRQSVGLPPIEVPIRG